jgi:hypothetical protein
MTQSSNSVAREIFETSPNSYVGVGFVVDTSSGLAINKLTLTGLNAQGVIQWEKRYGNQLPEFLTNGFIQRCMINHKGNLYYAGCLGDTTRAIGVLIKFNYNGDTLWRKIYRSLDPQEDVIPQMVTPSVDGGFLLTGFFQHWGNNTQPCLLIKTDANGNELWRKKINKSNPNVLDGKAIIQDSASKKIVIGGYQYKNGNSIYDCFVITDSLGNNPIQKSYTNSGGWITDLIQTWDKKIVAVGWMYTIVALYGQPTMQPFAIKFDLNNPNIPIWKTPAVNIYALYNGYTGIRELKNHDLLIGGLIDTVSGVVGASNMDPQNLWVRFSVYDENGNLKRNRFYDYKNNDPSVQYIQGMRSFNLCQDGGWVGAIDLANYGLNPFMFVRYDSTGCDTTQEYCHTLWTTSLKKENAYEKKIYFYPNPATNVFHLAKFDGEDGILELKDLLGKLILSQKISKSETEPFVELTNVPPGMYLITLESRNRIIYKSKIVKED